MFIPRDTDMSGIDDATSTGAMSSTMKMYFHGSIGTDMLWFASWMPTSAGATVGVCVALFLLAIFERYLVAFRRACDVSWRRGQIGLAIPKSSGPITFSSSAITTVTATVARQPASYRDGPPADVRRTSTQSSLDIIPVAAPTYSSQPASSSSSAADRDRKVDAEVGTGVYTGVGDAENDEKNDKNYNAHLPRAVQRSLQDGDDEDERRGRWSRPFRLGVDLPRGLMQALQTLVHYLLMLVVMTFNIWWVLSVVVGAGTGEMLFGRFGSPHAGH